MRQTHFQSFYFLPPELRLLTGLLAVRTITVILKHTPTTTLRQNWDDALEKLSESDGGRPYLLSSQPGFDLLTLVEVLQADLPESRQVLLRTNTATLYAACQTRMNTCRYIKVEH